MKEFSDDYEHIDDNIEYIPENILCEDEGFQYDFEYQKLKDDFNTILLNICECNGNDNCTDCHHGGNYIKYVFNEELILDTTKQRQLIYECSASCKCDPNKCLNRLVQYGPRKHLQIVDSSQYKSKGLASLRDIPLGAFVCEYGGELLSRRQAQERFKRNELEQTMNYILSLHEQPYKQDLHSRGYLTIIDPSRKGNIGRYINRSCEPNCTTISIRIDSPIPRIGIFSIKAISKTEELTFHYNEGIDLVLQSSEHPSSQPRISCLCKAQNCKKYLPNFAPQY